MLADPKSAALVKNFALQWLQIQRLQTFAPDAQMFPAFNDKLAPALMSASVPSEPQAILQYQKRTHRPLQQPGLRRPTMRMTVVGLVPLRTTDIVYVPGATWPM